MPKLKASRCFVCTRPLQRHDVKRVNIKVGKGSRGQGVFKEVHLACSQQRRFTNA